MVHDWEAIVEECFECDRERELRNHAPCSEVQESTAVLNQWSKMNVSEAKRPFSWKTPSELAAHLYEQLGIPRKDQLSSKDHGQIGCMPAVAKHLKSTLKKSNKNKPKSEHYDNLASKVSSFQWLTNVHEIFNATLMNTDIMITWYNIDRYIHTFNWYLIYSFTSDDFSILFLLYSLGLKSN